MISVKEAANSPADGMPFHGDLFHLGPSHEVARLLSDHMFDEIGRALADYQDDSQPFSVCPSPRTESPWPFIQPTGPTLTSMSSSSTIVSLGEQQLQKKKRKATATKRKRMLMDISTSGENSSMNNDSDDTGSFPPSSSSISTEDDEAANTSASSPPSSSSQRKRGKSSSSKDDLNGRQQRSRKSSSTYRGVSLCTKDSRWQARIRIKKEVVYLGRFETEEEAARRYDEAAREHHGDKALINFISAEDRALGRKSVFEQAGGKSVRM